MTWHIPLLGINPKDSKIKVLHENMYANYNSNILHNSQKVAAIQVFPKYLLIDVCINKILYIHAIEYLATLRNKVLIPITTRMSLQYIMLSERSQPQKAAHCMIPFSM